MPSQHEPVIKQEKKSQSQPVSQENNNTEVEKVLSQKLSQLSSLGSATCLRKTGQETNVGTDEEFDPELPGYSDADDENDATEETSTVDLSGTAEPPKPARNHKNPPKQSTVEEHQSGRKKGCKRVYNINFPYAVSNSVAAPKKKLHSVVKAVKEEAAAANLPSIAENSAADPEWLSEQVAVLKEKRDKEELRQKRIAWYENRFRTKSVELVDSVESQRQEENEKERAPEKKK